MPPLRFLTESVPAAASQALRALKHRNFRLFFFGQLLSLIGSWMQSLALGWLVWRLSRSAWLLGLVGFAQMSPVFFLGLLGGLAADRYDRHRIIIATQSAALVQATILAALTLTNRINVWEIIALAALLGVINAFDMPGRQAFVVQMVGREDLGNAIALNSSLFNVARVVGPALAGFVVGLWGEGVCFAINAVSFVSVLIALLLMRIEKAPAAPPSADAWTHVKQGLRYAWKTPHVRALLSLVTATSACALPFYYFLPAIAGGVLGRGPDALGALFAFAGAGAVAGALRMAHRTGIKGLGRTAGYSAIAFGAALAAFALSSNFYLSCGLIVAVGFLMMTQMAATNTLLQSYVPEELRGRLMSLYVITFVGVAPLGSLLQGKLAVLIGVQPILAAGGVVTLVAGLVFRLTLHRFRPPGGDQAGPS